MASGQVLASVQARSELRDILRLVERDLARLERILDDQCRSDVPLLGEMARYVKDGGGKRIRPALLLLAGGLCGSVTERTLEFGAVVEFIHTATLLHDDIIDEAALRRGRRTANSRWGNSMTVLLGDFLYAQSTGMALRTENLPILKLLSDVTLQMIEGEVQEIERCGSPDVAEQDHLDLIKRKTAHLFSACARIGGMVAGAGPEQERALAAYGLNLGICFQMVDDLLDFTGSEAILGKPVANDLREGKVTLPAIFLLRRATPAVAERVRAVLADRSFTHVTRDEIAQLAADAGALDEARRLAERYAEAARADLTPFGPSPHKDALLSIPDFILERQY
jgi:octaprenyl-diphosphate synthase